MRIRADGTVDHDAVFLPASTLRLSATPYPAYVRVGEPCTVTLNADYKVVSVEPLPAASPAQPRRP